MPVSRGTITLTVCGVKVPVSSADIGIEHNYCVERQNIGGVHTTISFSDALSYRILAAFGTRPQQILVYPEANNDLRLKFADAPVDVVENVLHNVNHLFLLAHASVERNDSGSFSGEVVFKKRSPQGRQAELFKD